MRHDVSIPGIITDHLGIPIPCQIEDISSTGMAISLEMIALDPGREPLKPDALATLEFAPDPDGDPTDNVIASVRVMWRAPTSIGVTFVEKTPQLKAALRSIAQAAVTARARNEDGHVRELTAEQRVMLQACRKTVQKLLPNIVWVMRTDLVKRLRTQADTTEGADSAAADADADMIESKAMAITRTIEHQFLQGFASVSDLEQTQEMMLANLRNTNNLKGSDGDPKSVLDENVAENNTRISAVAHAVGERHKSKFFELNVRLANVIGRALDDDVNPLIPASACRILWQAVTTYCNTPRVQKHLQPAMMTRVLPLLGELYDGLNATLDEYGAKRIFDVRQRDRFEPDE